MLARKASHVSILAHSGQYDRDNKPHWFHTDRVAKILRQRGYGDYVIASGHLHDILEDTDMTTDNLIEHGFPQEVVDVVVICSRKDGENYTDFIERIATSGNEAAIAVKIADVSDNLRRCQNPDIPNLDLPALAERYVKALKRLNGGVSWST